MVGALFIMAILIRSQAAALVRFTAAPSLAICFWRLLIAAGLLAPFALKRERRQALSNLDRKDWIHLALSGLFLFLHFYFFFRSAQETSIANSTILFSLNPVTTMIGAYLFFGEKVTPRLAAAAALGLAGVVALCSQSFRTDVTDLTGDLHAIVCAIFFSGYLLTGKHVRKKLPNALFSAAVYLQTAVYASFAMLAVQQSFFDYDAKTWLGFTLMALLPTLLGHLVLTYCLNYMNINFMSCMTLAEPMLAAAAATWLFSEPLTRYAVLGFLFTASSVWVLYWPTLVEFFRTRRAGGAAP